MANGIPNPDNHTATILVLEAICIVSMMAGASKEEAAENASHLFAAAYRETEMFRLDAMLAADGDAE